MNRRKAFLHCRRGQHIKNRMPQVRQDNGEGGESGTPQQSQTAQKALKPLRAR